MLGLYLGVEAGKLRYLTLYGDEDADTRRSSDRAYSNKHLRRNCLYNTNTCDRKN
ncbi:hypothetical protein OGM63_25050 [Plectonema radiosum NIES-515]|uniref:Transposase n=1 Tax=Plectonema radiosum NIES-515 TaxID=2986073 RepID=A0ABT3B5R9_9CYAN|nr:hypothetical protein [Plectonema radiosum]MCV3216732.1 hypothetical protein [Plectonema radiosum NIES-515]